VSSHSPKFEPSVNAINNSFVDDLMERSIFLLFHFLFVITPSSSIFWVQLLAAYGLAE